MQNQGLGYSNIGLQSAHAQGLGYGSIGIAQQNGDVINCGYSSTQVQNNMANERPITPVEQILHAINVELVDVHMIFSSLNSRLEFVRAPSVPSEDAIKPNVPASSKLEDELSNVLNGIRDLNKRISTTSAELRI